MKIKLFLISGVALLAIMIIFGIYFFKFASSEWSNNINDWSGFGNFVGGALSPILSFFALIALLFSIHHQTKELKKSNSMLTKQNNLIQKQSTETTYFHLLKLLNQIVQSLSIEIKNGNGRELRFENKEVFQELIRQFNLIQDTKMNKSLADTYSDFKNNYGGKISHYFEFISTILKFIDNNPYLDDQEKISYVSILRAQLSVHEQVLIDYNFKFGDEIEYSLIEKYQVISRNSEKFKAAVELRRSNSR